MVDTYYKGANSTNGFALEENWGVAGTVFKKFGIPTGTTDPTKTATIVNLGDMNLSREGKAQTVTANKYEIKYAFYVNDWFGLKSILGSVIKTGAVAPFTYTFSPDHCIPAFSFHHFIGNCDESKEISDIYVGCKVKTANFSINEGMLMCELTFSAKDREKDQGTIAITEVNAEPFKYADIVNGEATIDSKSIQVDEWSVSIDNKIVERQAGLLISEQSVQNIEYSQSTTGNMNQTDMRDLVGGSEVVMSVKFTRGVNDSIDFKTNVMIASAPNPTTKSDIVKTTITSNTRTLSIDYVSTTDIDVSSILL